MVGKVVVCTHGVELRRRLVVFRGPTASAVEGDGRAAVVGVHHALVVSRIDPEAVIVTVRSANLLPVLSRVGGLVKAFGGKRVYRVAFLRVGENVAVIILARVHSKAPVHELPCLTCIVGTIDAAFVTPNGCPQAVGIDGRNRQTDLAHLRLGQSVPQLRPGVASVRGLVDAGAGSELVDVPRPAQDLPGGGVHDAGVVRIDRKVYRAGLVVDEENLLPGPTAILGAESATLRVGTIRMSDGRDINQLGIARIDPYPPNLAGVAQADVLPGATPIRGFVHAISVREIRAQAGFAHAHVDNVRIGFGDRDRTYRAGVEVAIRNRRPGEPRVHRLPYASASGTHVVNQGIIRQTGDGGRAAAAVGTDGTPAQRLEKFPVSLRQGKRAG